MAEIALKEEEMNEEIEMITLVAEGRQFLCCKSKLVASSDYFRAMFSNNFTENAKNVIELQVRLYLQVSHGICVLSPIPAHQLCQNISLSHSYRKKYIVYFSLVCYVLLH